MTDNTELQLDSDVKAYIEHVHASLASFATAPTPLEFRQWTSELFAKQGEPVHRVDTRYIEIPTRHGAMKAKLYMPEDPNPALLVYMHGGGMIVGDIEGLDYPLHRVSHDAGVAVLSLDYALAPEHMYPVALEQCQDALTWAAANRQVLGVGQSLGVAGDSAGGNLTALLALWARDNGRPALRWQGMLNPNPDFISVETMGTESHRLFANGPILTNEVMQFFIQAYFGGGDTEQAKIEASPALRDNLTGLPPAFLGVGEYDPLRDDAVAYGERLSSVGVPATVHVFDGLVHNFVAMTHISKRAEDAVAEFIGAARAALNGTDENA